MANRRPIKASPLQVKLVEHLQLAEERAERAEEALARARSEKRDAGLADEVSQARAREQVASSNYRVRPL